MCSRHPSTGHLNPFLMSRKLISVVVSLLITNTDTPVDGMRGGHVAESPCSSSEIRDLAWKLDTIRVFTYLYHILSIRLRKNTNIVHAYSAVFFIYLVLWKLLHADKRGHVSKGVGLQSLKCWDHGFEFRLKHGCSSVVFIVCCVDTSLCDELIARLEESYRLCVI